eukprot:3339141-Alexandrium_andersonii.AAC.1
MGVPMIAQGVDRLPALTLSPLPRVDDVAACASPSPGLCVGSPEPPLAELVGDGPLVGRGKRRLGSGAGLRPRATPANDHGQRTPNGLRAK